jgi:ferritin
MMLVQFLLDADQPVTIPGVTAPRTEFANEAEPVALALDQERRVTDQIANLLKLAREEGDFVGEEAMHWFLKEQREEVSSMSDLLKLVERALESNILLAEEALARTPVGDQGVDPSAPPAAGGAL